MECQHTLAHTFTRTPILGAIVQLVEQGIVYSQVAGSSPVGTAVFCRSHLMAKRLALGARKSDLLHSIALSFNGRTSDYESEDWGSSPCEATIELTFGRGTP